MAPRTLVLALALGPAAGLLLACASSRPVLYPNNYFESVGPEIVKYDIDRCIEFAHRYAGRGSKSAEAAEAAAKDAARGGATGAAAGAVWKGTSAGRSAGAAAAGAATRSAMDSLFRARQLDPIEKRFVETCLRELGYQPAGWR